MHRPTWILAASVTGAALAGVALGAYIGISHAACVSRLRCWLCGKRKRSLPKRLILVRHGQSEGNIDPLLYCHVPDNAMHLTQLGYEQAMAAGKAIKALVNKETVRFIVSPYVRTIETFQGITKAWGSAARMIPWTEEPRIREQDFGNFQEPVKIRECKQQRQRFGSFFYRFPSGESPADVYDRVSSFLESLYRMFEKTSEDNYVLVTHGVAIRVILTRYFKYRICEFEQLENFHNGEFVVLELDPQTNKYNLVQLIHNKVDVSIDEEGRRKVKVSVEESSALRVRAPSEGIASLMRPYPTSPVNHFMRTPTPSSPTCSSTSTCPSFASPEDHEVTKLPNAMSRDVYDLPEIQGLA
ncbi:TPA: hypothetical protein N0F65_012708 [Lagenidium giganteum]|uniref:Phosphoglycerate mutase n=1 Tax=Lagenidium giganteum TaxID=4803 RepID=A0AAV2YEM4_9STRA|nr:TPA: hypothetical protein N0F65_012708 [Lagenidium giganteum]